MKRIPFFTSFFMMIALFAVTTACAPVYAQDPIAGSSAALTVYTPQTKDIRVTKLTEFLNYHKSPMTEVAEVFIEQADKYNLDWRLVVAIAGVESTFGMHIANAYNAYGWANGVYQFTSWEESIAIVSKTLREKYIDRGADTVEKIAPIYAPPSATWASKVLYFMDKIENFQDPDPDSLDLSL